MFYHPCKGCAVDVKTCKRRDEIHSAIKGLSVTSVKFKCTERSPYFKTGERVWVTLPFWEPVGTDGDSECHLAYFHGTVIYERNKLGSYKVKIDEGMDINDAGYVVPECLKSKTGYIAVLSKYMKSIDEPSLKVCKYCEGVDENHESYCSTQPQQAWY